MKNSLTALVFSTWNFLQFARFVFAHPTPFQLSGQEGKTTERERTRESKW